MEASIFEKWISDQKPKRSLPNIALCSPTSICKNNPHWKLNGFSIGSCLQSAFLTVISRVPYEFFLSLPCLSRKRKTVSFTGERRKRKRKRERNDSWDKLNITVRFLVPFLYNLTTTNWIGCLSYLSLKIISNASLNSKLNKNWFLGTFPPYT